MALLGTRYTMEQPFYVAHLARHGIACVVPEEEDRAEVHRVIFDELCKGHFDAGSRRRLAGIVARQVERGADGVLLGCTELTLSLTPDDVTVPLFDTTALHALAAVDFSLAPRPRWPECCARRGAPGARRAEAVAVRQQAARGALLGREREQDECRRRDGRDDHTGRTERSIGILGVRGRAGL